MIISSSWHPCITRAKMWWADSEVRASSKSQILWDVLVCNVQYLSNVEETEGTVMIGSWVAKGHVHGEQRLRSLLWMGQCIATDLSRCPWWPMQLKAPTMGMNIRTGTNTASCSIIHNVKPNWFIYLSIYFKEYISSIQMCKTLHRQADSWNTEDQDPTFQETRRSIFQSTMYSTLVLSLIDWLIDFYKIASNKEKVGGRKMNHLYFERGEGGQTRTANVNADFQIILKLLQKEQ